MMNLNKSRMGLLAVGMMGVVGILPVRAALPTMTEKQWLGYFVGVENRAFQFGFTSEGKAMIKPGKKGAWVSSKLTIPVTFKVLETMPDGKVVSRQIQPESLESAQPATDKPQNVVIKGKVTGDAGFEIFINEERGGISLGGRLLEPGILKNPLRFAIELKIPDVYVDAKKNGDKKAGKAFEEKTKNDRLQLVWTDKKRVKQSLTEAVDAGSAEINGPGIAGVQLELGAYHGRKIEVMASENSSITLENKPPAALVEGFSMTWTADVAKDPEGKARLSFGMK
jgi:hypothetical protein